MILASHCSRNHIHPKPDEIDYSKMRFHLFLCLFYAMGSGSYGRRMIQNYLYNTGREVSG